MIKKIESSLHGDLTVQYHYGADNRLENVTTKNSNGTKSFSFGYDSANRLTTLNYPNGVNSSFGYDSENRVISIQHENFVNRQIARNPLGFKTEEKINAGISPKPPKNERRLKTYNAADQLVSEKIQTATTNWSNVAYAYNKNGGLEKISENESEIVEFSYDYNNLISSVTSASSVVEYLHDASGARIGRVTDNGSLITTNLFVIDYTDGLKRPLAETDSSGNITRYYVWNGSQLLCHIESNGDVRYYHADELGSTLALTDKNGAVTDEFAYMPYGYATHSGATKTPYLWLGGYGVYYDSESNLHLTLHRAYSSSMKRFISPDPLGIDAFANIYAYGDLNPLAFIDPEGLDNINPHSYDFGIINNSVPPGIDSSGNVIGGGQSGTIFKAGIISTSAVVISGVVIIKAPAIISTIGSTAIKAGSKIAKTANSAGNFLASPIGQKITIDGTKLAASTPKGVAIVVAATLLYDNNKAFFETISKKPKSNHK